MVLGQQTALKLWTLYLGVGKLDDKGRAAPVHGLRVVHGLDYTHLSVSKLDDKRRAAPVHGLRVVHGFDCNSRNTSAPKGNKGAA